MGHFESDSDFKAIEAMRKYGGSFVKALANALDHADTTNYHKLKTAFPNYFYQYKKMAEKGNQNAKSE